MKLFKNGSFDRFLDQNQNIGDGAATVGANSIGNDIIQLVAGDTIHIEVRQTSGGLRATTAAGDRNYITIERISSLTTVGVFGTNEFLAVTSSTDTPASTATWHAIPGDDNVIALPPGEWQLNGFIDGGNSGSSPVYSQLEAIWSTNAGDDTGTLPTAATVQAGFAGRQTYPANAAATRIPVQTVRVKTITGTNIFLVPKFNMTTAANARVTVYIYAERIA
jgi:hypothetical protein